MILTGISKTNTIEYLWKKHCSEHFPKVKLDDDIFIDLQADDTYMAGIISTYLKIDDLTTPNKEIAQNILANFHKYDSVLNQLPSNIKYFKRSICLLNLILDKETDLRDILLFDGVKIVEIDKTQLKDTFILNSINEDMPKVGDIATIVEVYENQDIGLGIELECFSNNNNGIPVWLNPFPMSAIRIEPFDRLHINTTMIYIKLIEDFLENKTPVKEFETKYLSTFKAERGEMNKDLYLILENLFEDVDAYWEECLPENETNFMISEKTLRVEATKALEQLKMLNFLKV